MHVPLPLQKNIVKYLFRFWQHFQLIFSCIRWEKLDCKKNCFYLMRQFVFSSVWSTIIQFVFWSGNVSQSLYYICLLMNSSATPYYFVLTRRLDLAEPSGVDRYNPSVAYLNNVRMTMTFVVTHSSLTSVIYQT